MSLQNDTLFLVLLAVIAMIASCSSNKQKAQQLNTGSLPSAWWATQHETDFVFFITYGQATKVSENLSMQITCSGKCSSGSSLICESFGKQYAEKKLKKKQV